MKTVPSPLQAYVDGGGNIAVTEELYTLTLADGVTVFRWSTAAINITIGGNTWLRAGASAPQVTPEGYSQVQLPEIDEATYTVVGGPFTIGGESLTDCAREGLFTSARWQADVLMGPDLPTAQAWGPILSDFEGIVSDVSPAGDGTLSWTINTEPINLGRSSPFVVLAPRCNWTVYDVNCDPGQTLLAAKTLSGAASGVPTLTTIPTTSGALTAKAAGYFNLGFITFTSGALSGKIFDVDTWDGTTFSMAVPLPVAPAAGDAFTVAPGCPNTLGVCSATFGNLANWRGFTHLPTTETAGT